MREPGLLTAACTLMLLGIAARAGAQELEPRAFSPAPIGTRILLAGVGNSECAFVLDPALPITDVEADITFALIGAGYTFDLWRRQARILVIAPYAWGDVTAEGNGVPQVADLEGFVDPRVKFSIGLVGAPALNAADFSRAARRTALGFGLTVLSPVGQYDRASLVNLGYNRWAVKPEIGLTHPVNRWTWEAAIGVWLFGDNDRYFPGTARRSQGSIGTFQGHVGYSFPNRSWIALDAAWFSGGRTRVDGVPNTDRQHNSRIGLTYSYPLGRRQSLKLSYSTGSSTERGSDYDTVNLTWQWVRY